MRGYGFGVYSCVLYNIFLKLAEGTILLKGTKFEEKFYGGKRLSGISKGSNEKQIFF